MNKTFLPLFIKSSGIKILTFGGGSVALRKCKHFEDSEITVVSQSVLPELKELAKKVILTEIPDDVGEMVKGYDLVIATTDDKSLNLRIQEQAIRSGVRVNSAHGGGDVLIPSVLEREGYTVAVSSDSKAPAFPPYIIKTLDGFLDERFDIMLDLVIEMREYALNNIPTHIRRRTFLESVTSDPQIQNAVAEGDIDRARTLALGKVPL